ncbi:MAG: hypothetical protein HC840_23265 [Leptolyngbyaceae cyanobacterium RM2_2_4]|nr:hypothetical protein [Leptolyngbyaceae cyanobacterium RM2_2_4]
MSAIPYVTAAADFANQVRNGTPTAQAAARSGGALAGGIAGGQAGAAVGQVVIPIPVVGAAIGGIVGGLAGSLGGGAVADRLYNEALNRFAGVVPLPVSAQLPDTQVSLRDLHKNKVPFFEARLRRASKNGILNKRRSLSYGQGFLRKVSLELSELEWLPRIKPTSQGLRITRSPSESRSTKLPNREQQILATNRQRTH